VRVIAVSGELDLSTAPDLERPLEAAVDGGETPVLIDLSKCEFIDSTGIALIVRAWQRLNGDNAGLAICCPTDQVRRVLGISGLDRSIPVQDSRDAGVAHLRG
jgi:anti-sigma B factor antagonist